MSNPTTPFSWQMPTNTDLVTDLPADFEVFGQAVATSMADLLGGTTGQILAKASNADMDFVWSADAAGMTNPMTTTGDSIYSSSGSTPARLGIGTTGQVLTVAGGIPSWATPSASMTLLSTTSMNTGTATVTVSGISGSYKKLQVVILNPTWGTGNSQLLLSAQSSSSLQGAGSTMYNSGANVAAAAYSGTSMSPTAQQVSNTTGRLNVVWEFYNYASTTAYKSWGLYYGDDSRGGIAGGVVATNTAISNFSVTTTSGYNFNGGSILVYGIN